MDWLEIYLWGSAVGVVLGLILAWALVALANVWGNELDAARAAMLVLLVIGAGLLSWVTIPIFGWVLWSARH